MRFCCRKRFIVAVLVMIIMHVAVIMFHVFMRVVMRMPLRQMQPCANRHQHTRDDNNWS